MIRSPLSFLLIEAALGFPSDALKPESWYSLYGGGGGHMVVKGDHMMVMVINGDHTRAKYVV